MSSTEITFDDLDAIKEALSGLQYGVTGLAGMEGDIVLRLYDQTGNNPTHKAFTVRWPVNGTPTVEGAYNADGLLPAEERNDDQ